MKIDVYANADEAAREAAKFIASAAQAAVAARDLFTLAASGGTTPWQMLSCLAKENLPWSKIHVFQVDERIAPAGDPDRNLTHLRESLLSHAPLPPENIHAMPVEMDDSEAGADEYATALVRIAGDPILLDLVHLGLGPDGHTASLVPEDSVLRVTKRAVALSGPYQNRMRMTLTYPVLNRARQILWLATGDGKVEMLPRLMAGDHCIPAGRVNPDRAVIFADRAATAKLDGG